MFPVMRDIIDVPVAQTVVRLGDASDEGKRAEVVREFVLTRQVERNLRAIASSLKEGHGRGHFLIGAYGSGKSHFLSYTSLVASGETLPSHACPIAETVRGRRLLPVRCSLVRVRSDIRLEDAILSEAERQLRVLKVNDPISRRSRFLSHVESSIRPINVAHMDSYLAEKGFPSWDALQSDQDRAVAAAWGYVKELEGCPTLPDMPPDELISGALNAARGAGFDGVLIVIDELSEFLRSKPTRAALSEDARYLQFLGEFARSEPLWIIASLQEAIERSGDIARDVIAKIKDRYPVTLSLDEHHILELIDGRLVRKQEGARERIREVWRGFSECVPNFEIDFESFYRIYPVHPATIRYLEGLKFLFSAHRGVVDFLVAQVRGDEARGNKGLMGCTADHLLTADRIYSHFGDRISSDSRFADFDAVVRRDLMHATAKLFEDDADRVLAERAVDVLILNELAEGEKPKTVSELAGILLAAVTDVSAEVNSQYLAEVILAPLLKESLFLHLEPAEKPGDRIFRVSLERDRRGLFKQELERVLSGISLDDSRVIGSLLENVPSALPIREMKGDAIPEVVVQWRGTHRRGAIFRAGIHSFSDIAHRLESGAAAFAVVVASYETVEGLGDYPQGTLVWTPGFTDNEREAMRQYYGAAIIADEKDTMAVERAVCDEAKQRVEEGRSQVAKIIEAGYKRGKFICPTGESFGAAGPASASGFLERCISEPAISLLKVIHPKFLEVAPEVEFVSRRALAPLVDAILAPGKITMANARKNNTRMMIEGVLIPMGLARVQGPSFAMQLDSARSPLVREALDLIASGLAVDVFLRKFMRGSWGLSGEMASLLIVALVRGGLVELKKNGRRIPSGIVSLSHVEEADEICAGELLNPSLRDRLLRDSALSHGLDAGSYSLSSQRESWERLLSLRDKIEADAAEILPKLAAISEYPIFDAFDFERIRAIVDLGLEAVRGVEDAKGAGKGLAQYLSVDRPDMAAILREMAAIREFVCSDADRVIRIADYLREIPADCEMPEDVTLQLMETRNLLSRLTEVVLSGATPTIFAAFDRFFECYVPWYVDEHRRAFAMERFAPLTSIRQTQTYFALRAASAICGIHLAYGVGVADRKIDSALAMRCTRSPSAELRLKAACGCGFVPGKNISIGDAEDIMKGVHTGLTEALRALSDAAVLEKLVARISATKDIDLDKAQRLEDIFHRLRGDPTIEAFVGFMTQDVAELLDEALRRKVTIVSRDLNALVERLCGRRLPPGRLRTIFDEWLGCSSEGDVVVDVGSGKEAKSVEGAIAAWISDHGLDDAGARLALVVPPDAIASIGDEFLPADEDRLARMAGLVGLLTADGDECLRLLKRERRCKQFAWEIARRLAQCLIDGWRPKEGDIACAFSEVMAWIKAAILATAAFGKMPINEIVRIEAPREAAVAFLNDYRCLHQFPSEQVALRLCEVARCAGISRDEVFSAVKPWNLKLEDVLNQYPDAMFLFVDAMRWDLVARFDTVLRRITGRNIVQENWYTAAGASTTMWQRAFFGTDDLDAISAMMQNRKIRYVSNVERSDVCAKLRDEPPEGPVWLRACFVDQALHSTSLPLYKLFDELIREFEEMLLSLSSVISAREHIILLTDHGFSEVEHQVAGKTRYSHDATRPADTVATMIVYEREDLP